MMPNKRIVSIFELIVIVTSIFAFSYFISTDLPEFFEKESSFVQYLARPIIPIVSANANVPSGCCKETIFGATCQDMVLSDEGSCKTSLIGTSCEVVSECQKGCCYDSDSGICSLNAPKDKCVSNGGTWDPSETCNIAECQVGCCILGDGAALTTTRECTQMARDYKIDKIFKPLDNKGSCDSYSDPTEMGACLSESDDFSDEKQCVFTTKAKCLSSGREFRRGYLCSSEELNTVCEKTEKTSCFEGDDRVYFLDSCGNKANVYDSSKADNQEYWERIVSPADSCTGSPENCGNCNYATGSICTKYVSGKDLIKPDIGNYVCRNLDCANGKKHGESWCISDSDGSDVASNPVGSRSYVATCFEGEIILDGCADFNQEVCIQNDARELGYSEARCEVNDWRACIYANDYDDYTKIEKKCNELPQCIMFNEIPGNEKYADLPGFKENILNDDQGRAGSVGKGINTYVIQCVPKYTPGYQFWTSSGLSSNVFSKNTKTTLDSGANYGGSKEETDAICGLASFKCVSHIITETPLINPTPKDAENPECNMQAVSQSKQKVSLMMEALNEKCKAMGSCGVQYNVQGEVGSGGFEVNRVYIDKNGKTHTGYTTEGYELNAEYVNDTLKEKQEGIPMGDIETLSALTELNSVSASIFGLGYFMMTGFAFNNQPTTTTQTSQEAGMAVGASAADAQATQSQIQQIEMGAGALAGFGAAYVGVSYTATTTIINQAGQIVATVSYSAASPAAAQAAAQAGASSLTSNGVNSIGSTSVAGNLGASLSVAGLSLAGAILGSYVGQMIAKSAGMTPGEATAFVGIASATGSVTLVGAAWAIGYFAQWGNLCLAVPITCILVAVMAVIMIVYSAFTGEDHEYFITEFKCAAWEPPAYGDCNTCNDDVRSCTEYKCKSIGNNCHYFVDNGEPGYCASMADSWSAKIKPWEEKLTEGNSYSNVSFAGFKIINKENPGKEVDAWRALTFGIITDKEAICKIDIDHSLKYGEMRFNMFSDKNYETGKVDGKSHWITLSPHTVIGETDLDRALTTLPLEEGENEYYVRCQNFAGQVNEAPFIVQVKQAEGPDLTPAYITRMSPEDGSYLAYGSKNTTMWVYLDEPAECRYSLDYDYNYFEEMPYNFSCLTGTNQAFYGEWPCAAFVPNISNNVKMFIKCKDQPGLNETDLLKRNQNSISYQFGASVCSTGLNIKSVSPQGIKEVSNAAEIDLEVRTEGCINNGESSCSYKMPYYGNIYSTFFETDGNLHKQPLTSLGTGGMRTVDIECIDGAGNVANTSINFTIIVDDLSPNINRVYIDGGNLVLKTSEEAECLFVQNNATIGCDFGFDNAQGEYSITHNIPITENANDVYYIKCIDNNGNAPTGGCTQIIKLSEL